MSVEGMSEGRKPRTKLEPLPLQQAQLFPIFQSDAGQQSKAIRSDRRVQWGPNEKDFIDRELDEKAENANAFAALRIALQAHRDQIERDPDSSPPQNLEFFVHPNETEGLPTSHHGDSTTIPAKSSKRTSFKQTNLPSSFFKRKADEDGSNQKANDHISRDEELVKEEEGEGPGPNPGIHPTNHANHEEREGEFDHTFLSHGSGILSALLSALHRQQDRFSSAASSQHSTDTDLPNNTHENNQDRHHSASIPQTPKFRMGKRELSIESIISKISGDDNITATRSAAGVFGHLLAATGNLSSIAAPVNSSVAPDLKRRGYRLSRYTHADPEQRSQPPSRAGSTSLSPVETRHESAQGGTPTNINAPSGSPVKGRGWSSTLKGMSSGLSSRRRSPDTTDTEAEPNRVKRHKHRKTKRKREEIYITMHVANIITRQQFILKMARAFLMFGSPSHRLEMQIQATGRILGLNVSCMYIPGIILISFNDLATGTSNLKFVKQASSLDLGKLIEAYALYWSVVNDEIGVSAASSILDELMLRRPIYENWTTVLIGGLCSSFVCPILSKGSFVDSLMAFPFGAALVYVQNHSAKNELYNNVFEIVIATFISFVAGALASTGVFCYTAVTSASIVLILPGWFILCGSLEIATRNITAGAVRMCYSVIYSLFLGFGLAMGAEVYHQVSGKVIIGDTDYKCTTTHDPDGPWWRRQASPYWAFLCTPMYALCLSLRNQAPLSRKELYVSCLIACGAWTANHFASQRFVNRSDISSAIGAFLVGVAGNIYGRFYQGNAFVVMITGILFQLPTGLSNGGLLIFASQATESNPNPYITGFQVAEQLVSVAIGLAVGLFIAAVAVHPFGGSRRRGIALFSL